MSECTTSYEDIRSLIIDKFDAVLALVTRRREELLDQLERTYPNYKSGISSKLKELEELEQMHKGFQSYSAHQNRASQAQRAALQPIITEIQNLKDILNDYKIDFKFDADQVEKCVANLGEIVEPVYNTTTPPALPPRPIRKSNSYNGVSRLNVSSPDRRISLSPTPYSRDSTEEVEFTTVVPQVSSAPKRSSSLPLYSSKRRPIFAACDRGTESQELLAPMGMTYHHRYNYIYVVDQKLHKVLVLSSNADYVMEFGENVLVKPISIAVSDEYCCVSDEALNGVVKFRLRGSVVLGKIASFAEGSARGELSKPKGLDLDAANCLYLADSENNRVCILDTNLTIRMAFGSAYQSPQDVKISKEIIYVLDCNPSACLHSVTLSGTPIRSILSVKSDIFLPTFFCLDSTGHILVSHGATSVVKVFSLDGRLVCKVGEETNSWEKGILAPKGLCVTTDNRVVCAFSKGESVICFY